MITRTYKYQTQQSNKCDLDQCIIMQLSMQITDQRESGILVTAAVTWWEIEPQCRKESHSFSLVGVLECLNVHGHQVAVTAGSRVLRTEGHVDRNRLALNRISVCCSQPDKITTVDNRRGKCTNAMHAFNFLCVTISWTNMQCTQKLASCSVQFWIGSRPPHL